MFKIKRHHLYFIYSLILYIFALEFMYKYFLYPRYEYFGYKFELSSWFDIILSYFLILIPSRSIYRKRNLLSKFYIIFVYLVIYIPTLVFVNHIRDIPDYLIIVYKIILFIGMEASLKIIKSKKYVKFIERKIKTIYVFRILILTAVVYLVYSVMKYREYFSFLSFNDIYEKRSIMEIGKIDGYFNMWVSNFILPIILAYGLIKKKYIYAIMAIISSVIIYGLFSNKISLFSVIFILLLNLIDFKSGKYVIKMALILSVSIIGLTVLSIISNNLLINMICGLILMRTLSVPGLLTVQYMHYFFRHPYIYYSNMNIVNSLVYKYPYKRPLGFIVGEYFSGNDAYNANANFIATDGIAALGPLGIIIIFLIFSIILKILDSVTRNSNQKFAYLSSVYFIMTLLNISLFTTFFSGGLLFFILFFLFFSLKKKGLTQVN